jgi:hypothetical protein
MTKPSICVITPTIGRPTLRRTLESGILGQNDLWFVLQDSEGEGVYDIWYELRKSRPYLYLFETQYSGNYGNSLRDYAIRVSQSKYFIFLDDDDIFAPGAIQIIKQEIALHHPKPIIFKMVNGNGEHLWRTRDITPGNVGGSMFCCPNIPGKLGKWDNGAGHRSDFEFIRGTLEKYGPDWRQQLAWSGEVIIHCRPENWQRNRENVKGTITWKEVD